MSVSRSPKKIMRAFARGKRFPSAAVLYAQFFFVCSMIIFVRSARVLQSHSLTDYFRLSSKYICDVFVQITCFPPTDQKGPDLEGNLHEAHITPSHRSRVFPLRKPEHIFACVFCSLFCSSRAGFRTGTVLPVWTSDAWRVIQARVWKRDVCVCSLFRTQNQNQKEMWKHQSAICATSKAHLHCQGLVRPRAGESRNHCVLDNISCHTVHTILVFVGLFWTPRPTSLDYRISTAVCNAALAKWLGHSWNGQRSPFLCRIYCCLGPLKKHVLCRFWFFICVCVCVIQKFRLPSCTQPCETGPLRKTVP